MKINTFDNIRQQIIEESNIINDQLFHTNPNLLIPNTEILAGPSTQSKKEPIYIMTVEMEKGISETIDIYSDSIPDELAFEFCKLHNLDFSALNYLTKEITQLLESLNLNSKIFVTLGGTDLIPEVDEEESVTDHNRQGSKGRSLDSGSNVEKRSQHVLIKDNLSSFEHKEEINSEVLRKEHHNENSHLISSSVNNSINPRDLANASKMSQKNENNLSIQNQSENKINSVPNPKQNLFKYELLMDNKKPVENIDKDRKIINADSIIKKLLENPQTSNIYNLGSSINKVIDHSKTNQSNHKSLLKSNYNRFK